MCNAPRATTLKGQLAELGVLVMLVLVIVMAPISLTVRGFMELIWNAPDPSPPQ